jgi:glycosyltransferase involved in cell wall biosynthesis
MTFPEPAPESAVRALAALPEPLRRHLAETLLPLCGWRPGEPAGEAPGLAGRRIGFFRRNLRRGGSARVMIEQLAALRSAGASADVYYFEEGADPDVVAEIRARAPPGGRIRRVSRRLASWRTLALELAPRRHDLFISTDIQDPFIFGNTVSRLGLMRPPRVAAVMHEEYDRYLAFLRPHAARLAAVCLDYDFRDRFRALYGDALPAGIVAPLFPLPEQPAAGPSLRGELGIPAGGRVLAYAGRLDRNKRIEFLADVLADLLAAGRDAWLLLAGRWEEESYRREVLAGLDREVALPGGGRVRLGDRVREAGPVPSLGPVFAAADLFAFASRTEGFYPLVVMEAQQAGLPVVCTGAGGLGRAILDGVTGFLAPGEPGPEGVGLGPETRRVFGERAGRLLDDPALARALGRNGALAVAFLTRHYPFPRLFLEWVRSALEPGRAP